MSIKVGGLEVNLGGGYRWSGPGGHEITDLTGSDSDSDSDDAPPMNCPPVAGEPPSQPPPAQSTDYPSTAGADGDLSLQGHTEDKNRLAAELFTSDLKPSLTCPICFEVPLNIRRCNVGCGKCICDPCAKGWFNLKEACPSCNVSTTYEGLIVGGGPMFNEILSMAMMDCPNKPRGCSFNGNVTAVEQHQHTCKYGVVSCEASACTARLLRRDQEEHTRLFCRFGLVSCRYCSQGICRKDLVDHSNFCLERPVACEHCWREMPSRQMQNHSEVCPRRPVSCRFCQARVADEEYSGHIMGQHGEDLPALLLQMDELEAECHRLRFQVQTLQEGSASNGAQAPSGPALVAAAPAAVAQAPALRNQNTKMAKHIKIPLKVTMEQADGRCSFTSTIFSSSFLGEAQVMAKQGTVYGFSWKKRPRAGGAAGQAIELKLCVEGTPTPDRMEVWSGGVETDVLTMQWEGCVTQADSKKLTIVIPGSEQKWKLKYVVSTGYK